MRAAILPILVLAIPTTALAHEPAAYQDLRRAITVEQQQTRLSLQRLPRAGRLEVRAGLETRLLRRVDQLHRAWLGTRWGLGMPQTTHPGKGKVNCGLFVALVLRHMGFNLNIWKFNRQAASDAIRSVAPRRTRKHFSNTPMKRFLKRVRAMGPGLFIIGLDFHIGFLRQTEDDLRFVHASYIDHKVVDEPAATAVPIVTSKYRVVGKILQPGMRNTWLAGRRIKVLGKR
jgi:hypothetical protein